jgi:hypothetical protein
MGNVERQRVHGITDSPVIVIWHDAHAGVQQWEHLDDLSDDEPYEVHTAGFLVTGKMGGKRNHVSVVQSYAVEGFVDSMIHIPKKMVVEIIQLERNRDANKPADSPDRSPIP